MLQMIQRHKNRVLKLWCVDRISQLYIACEAILREIVILLLHSTDRSSGGILNEPSIGLLGFPFFTIERCFARKVQSLSLVWE